MDPDTVTLGNGAKVRIPGYSALTPDQQTQRVAQVEREIRVAKAAQGISAREAEIRGGTEGGFGGFYRSMNEAADEFTRNMTLGLTDYLGAGISYLEPEGGPSEGLDFWERRDALRMAQDNEAEQFLPGWVDNAASLAGVLSSGGTSMLPGFYNAVKTGAGMGMAEGIGGSDAQDLSGLGWDALKGLAIGGAVGGTADLVLDKLVGGFARKLFAQPEIPGGVQGSKAAYLTQKRLGIEPSIGSIGNRTARSFENAFAENPVMAAISEGTRQVTQVPFVTGPMGRSSIDNQVMQSEQLADALTSKVAGPLREADPTPLPPDALVPVNDADLAGELRRVARVADAGYEAEKRLLEMQFAGLVPRGTPVNITRTRRLPEDMLANNSSADLAGRTQAEIDTILKNKRTPVNTARDAQLNNTLGRIDGQLVQIDSQLAAMADKSTPQAKALMRTRDKLVRDRQKTLTLVDNNKGPAFAALREDRSMIGANVGEGLANRDSSMLYEAITRDLEAAAARIGGPNARKAFRDMTQREREIFMSQRLIKPLLTTEGAATNIPAVKRAVLSGNDAEFAALTANLPPNEMNALRANLLESLGRNTAQEPFVPKTFADNWRRMSPEAKAKITQGNPETLAVLEAIAHTAESFHARGMAANRSNSASAAGAAAFLGAAVASPNKVLPFLMLTAGADRALASEALTKAVAGEPTALGQLVRRAIMTLPANEEASAFLFGEGGQP